MKRLLTSVAALSVAAGMVQAQSADLPANIERLQSMQSTGVKDFTVVDQTGDYAAGIKKNLERIKMPDGFKIELYAIVPDARHIAVGPQGVRHLSARARTRSGSSPTATRTASPTRSRISRRR